MTATDTAYVVLVLAAIVLATPIFGSWITRSLGDTPPPGLGWLKPLERAIYRIAGIDPTVDMGWKRYALDLTASHVATPEDPLGRAALMVGGVLAIGAGSALYLTTGLGPGPRDGLMTSLHRHLHVSVVYVRLALEITVLVVGWLMGGVVGVGTAFFALTIGFSIGASLQLLERCVHWASRD